jgi:hypothetical protein
MYSPLAIQFNVPICSNLRGSGGKKKKKNQLHKLKSTSAKLPAHCIEPAMMLLECDDSLPGGQMEMADFKMGTSGGEVLNVASH